MERWKGEAQQPRKVTTALRNYQRAGTSRYCVGDLGSLFRLDQKRYRRIILARSTLASVSQKTD